MAQYDEAIGGPLSKSLPEEKELSMSSALRDEMALNVLRKRHVWHSDADSLHSDDSDLMDEDDEDELAEDDEDAVGCPLPSTPEDNQLLEEEVIIVYANNKSFFPIPF